MEGKISENGGVNSKNESRNLLKFVAIKSS